MERNNSSSRSEENESIVRQQDLLLPIANVVKIMRKVIPTDGKNKIANDAKEAINESVSEFISFITCQANEHCQTKQRCTITAEDILYAMDKLGFDNYIKPLTVYLQRYRQFENNNSRVGEPFLRRSDTAAGVGGAVPGAVYMAHAHVHMAEAQAHALAHMAHALAPAGIFAGLPYCMNASASGGEGPSAPPDADNRPPDRQHQK